MIMVRDVGCLEIHKKSRASLKGRGRQDDAWRRSWSTTSAWKAERHSNMLETNVMLGVN